MKFSEYLETGKNRYSSFGEMIKDLSAQKNERDEQQKRMQDLQGFGNQISSFHTDWSNYFNNGGTVSGDGYFDLARRKTALLTGVDSMMEQYSGDAGATEYLKGLDEYLKGESRNVIQYNRINKYNNLATKYEGLTKTLGEYGTKINEGAYLSKDELDAYTEAAQDYIAIGGKLFTEENGYDQAVINGFQRNHPHIANSVAKASEFYSQFDSEESYTNWKKYYDKWGHYTNTEDFEEYVAKGAAIENPKFEDAENSGRFLFWEWEGDEVGNIVTYSRENADMLAMAYGNGAETQGNYVYRSMTDEEVSIYNYILAKYGKEKGAEFLSEIEDSLRNREGKATAERILNIDIPVVEELALIGHGLGAGIENAVQGTKQAFSSEKLPTSISQYATSYINESEDIKQYQKYIYGGATTVGNMLPAIAVTYITGGFGAPAGFASIAGTASMGLSAGGNAYGQALADGYSKEQAASYGVLVGASEALLQYMLGGIGKLGGAKTGKILTKIEAIDNAFLRVSAKLGINIAKEIGEEELQLWLEPAFQTIIFGEDYDAPTIDEMLETAIVTALSTGALESAGTIGGDVKNSKYYKSKVGGSQQELVAQSLETPEGSLSNKLGQKYQAKLDNGKDLSGHQLGRLVEANEQQFRSEDISKIQSAVEGRLTELGETGDVSAVAAALTKQAAGEKLSRTEQKLISESKYGNRVANELNPENIKSEGYSTGWAEGIDTERINVEEYSRLVKEAELAGETTETTGGDDVTTEVPKSVLLARDGSTSVSTPVDASVDTAVSDVYRAAQINKAAPATESAEPEVGSDVEGKTFVESTGEVADSVAVKSIGADGVTVTVNGKTDTSMDDVSFGDEATNERFHYVTGIDGMTAETANAILQHDDIGKENFARDAVRAFRAGVRNDKLVLGRLDPDVISKADAEAFFQKGREAAREAKNAENKAVKAKAAGEVKEKAGGVYIGYDGKTIDQREGKLSKKQRVAVDFTKRMAKKFGAKYYFYESYKDENGNLVYKDKDGNIREAKKGFYDPSDGSIHIDLNGDNLIFTVAHELVHFIRDWSPVRFKKMADLVMEGFNRQNVSAEELIMAKQAEYAEDGIALTEDQAFEEVVAASLEEVLIDGRVMELMRKIEATDKGLAAKVKKFFQDIAGLIRDVIDSYKGVRSDSPEASIIRKMEDIYQNLQVAFAKGAMDAGKNFQNAENTTGEGGVRYTIVNLDSGKSYVQASRQVISGNSVSMWRTQISAFFRNALKNGPIEIETIEGDILTISRHTAEKARSKATTENGITRELTDNEFLVKLHAESHIDELAEISRKTNRPPVPDDKNHSFAKDGFTYRTVYFQDFDNAYYKITISVGENNGVSTVYNVGKIKADDIPDGNIISTIGSKADMSSTRYSIGNPDKNVKKNSSTDSDGNQLSKGQQAYFAESKERDADGNLRVMYRGDSEEVTVFDRKKSKASNLYGRGFYYTSEKSHAGQYGIVRAFYLNTVNPLMPDQHSITKTQMLRFLEAIENDGEDYDLYNYGENATAKSVLESVWGKGDFEMLQDVSASAIGDLVAAVELFNEINGTTYDSIRLPTETVIFNSNQAKLTSNKNPTDNPDIRYSVGRKTEAAVQEVLEKENAQLREDVAKLKELVKLQGQETGGTKFTPSTVLAAARYIKKLSGSKANTKELSGMLNDFYEYIATNKDLTWESVREQAQPIAQFLMDQVEHTRTAYAQEVLDQMKGGKVYLDETQMKEAEYLFGSYNDFRKALGGAITVARNASMSLDVWWQEMSTLYPDVFGVDVTASDMVRQLADIVNSLRNENSSALEYAYNRKWIEHDLIRDLYDSYWRVSNLRTVADRYAAKHNRLVIDHNQRINALKTANREKIEELKEQHRAEVEMIRKAYQQKSETQRKALSDKYRESRKKAMESRNKTEMRHKIRRVVKELHSLLMADDKKRHVPDSLKKAVAGALDVLNLDTSNLEERVAKYEKLIAEETDPEKIDAYQLTMENIIHAGEKLGEKLAQLHTAYQAIVDSADPDIQGGYDEAIDHAIQELSLTIGSTPVNKLSMDQLEDVYTVYTAILNRVRDANKSLADSQKKNIAEWGTEVMTETKAAGGVHDDRVTALDGVKQFGWNNMKPVYAFETIGSAALTRAYNNVRKGEDTWAVDVTAARAFFRKMAKEYKYDSWDMKKTYGFESTSGKKFKLTLEQMMSLYAYSKREAADKHLRLGGFVFDSNIAFRKEKENGKKSVLKYKINTAAAYQIDLATMQEIVKTVAEIPGVTGFVDAMQDYLSTTMGVKGNEVSVKMYGIKLFKEKNYFPLKSAKQFLFEQNEVAGEVKIKNSGFTNKIKAGANNPIILSNFTDVWAQHVNDMSMYHAFTLPLEDFNRLFNFKIAAKKEGADSESVKGTIQSAYGPAAVSYVQQLIKDLNGGAIADPRESTGKALLAKFKKAKVMASLSVVFQQPSAIGRAFALVNPKYFRPTRDGMNHRQLWEELKTYAPVAIIKEMGHFDTGMGLGVKDYLMQKEYSGFREKVKGFLTDANFRDEVISKVPALADELTWCAIWNAVKRETLAKHSDLSPRSEEFLTIAGKRFTEVITKTQVYDSVLARSANMRSKSGLMSMVTSFMAEPTTTINMLEDAARQGKRGNRKYAAGAFASVAVAIVLNNALASLVYTMRDDDEDETYAEKYMQSFVSGMIDDINPLTYYPYLKDMWSVMQGYDVERSDMSLIAEASDSVKGIVKAYIDEDGDVSGAWWDLAGAVANIGGIPLDNFRREISGARNLIDTLIKDYTERDTTWQSMKNAIGSAAKDTVPIWGLISNYSKTDKLYDAIVSGDQEYVNRLKGGYKDQNAVNNAIRKGLRENDSRIREAAIAWNAGELDEYMRIAKEIIGEKNFVQDDVVMAIRAEASALEPEAGTSSTGSKAKGLFTAESFAEVVSQGDADMAEIIREDLIDTDVKNGKTQEEAEKSFVSSVKSEMKELFLSGDITEDQAMDALEDWCGKTETEARADVQYWAFKQAHPDVQVDDQWFDTYYEKVAKSGLDIAVYMEYRNQVADITGDKKKDSRMAVIHSLPITKAQKDALYLAEGWAESKLHEAPWH